MRFPCPVRTLHEEGENAVNQTHDGRLGGCVRRDLEGHAAKDEITARSLIAIKYANMHRNVRKSDDFMISTENYANISQ